MLPRPALGLVLAAVAVALAACGGGDDADRMDIPRVDLQDPRTAPTATMPAGALPTAVPAVSVTPRALKEDTTPTPTGTPQAGGTPQATATPGGSGRQTYVVKEGDTLAGIAQRFGVSYEALCRANNIDPNNPRFHVGDELVIPAR